MKSLFRSLKALASAMLFSLLIGCVYNPAVNRTVPLSSNSKSDAVLEAAVDAARQANFPPMTKMDKANGIVEFGNFGQTDTELAAQVRIRPDSQADITVKRASVYIKVGVDGDADKFKAAFEDRLRALDLLRK